MAEERRDWRELCAAIAKEEDQMRLLELVEELLAVLDKREYDCLEHSAKTKANRESRRSGRTSRASRTARKRGGVI
jgi:hypothetical protein